MSVRKYDSRIIDLGAAPGSWSQVLSSLVRPTANIVAIDLLPIKPIHQVQTISLDFTSDNAFEMISEAFNCHSENLSANLIISDLCANLSGNSCIDSSNNLHLWKLALNFTNIALAPNGHFLLKFFESKESFCFRKSLEKYFNRVVVFKPLASRSVSSEKYFVCLNKK
jgi:23S rRNA (uridine2552-2'-O)-methyltransferase